MDTDPGAARVWCRPARKASDCASRALQGVNHTHVAPRVGLSPTASRATRRWCAAVAGIFYSNMITVGGMQSMEINPPNHLRINLTHRPQRRRRIVLEPGVRAATR